jgi:hypothetical protein
MRVLLLLGVLFGVAIVTACGTGNDGEESGDLLHLRESDISESAYRNLVRAMLLEAGAMNFCEGIQGLSAEEVVDLSGTPNPSATPLPGGTPMPGQSPVPSDLRRAATIMQEECERILRP